MIVKIHNMKIKLAYINKTVTKIEQLQTLKNDHEYV